MIEKANKVRITGTIVGKVETTNEVSLRVATNGCDTHRNVVASFPDIVFKNKKIVEGYSTKNRVTVTGYMHGSKVCGIKIEKCKRPLATFLQEIEQTAPGCYKRDENIAYICGRTEGVNQINNYLVILELRAPILQGDEMVRIACFGPVKDKAVHLNPGDLVATVSYLQTMLTKTNKQPVLSVTCRDLEKIME